MLFYFRQGKCDAEMKRREANVYVETGLRNFLLLMRHVKLLSLFRLLVLDGDQIEILIEE